MKKINIWAMLFLALALLGSPLNSVNADSLINKPSKDLYNEIDNPSVQVFNLSGRSLYVTNKDIQLMAAVVYAESCGEPHEGQVAVASVILNRLQNPDFPHSIEGVIKQKDAFSCIKNGKITVEPNKSSYEAVFEALEGNDPTANALFFYNPRTSTSPWMKNIQKHNLKAIGNHVFFGLSNR